jgi:predicted dehydrogenase
MSASAISRRSFLATGSALTSTAALTAASYSRVLGANDRIGVGFIGYGLIGKRHVIDFQEQPDVAMVSVAEVHAGRLEEARQLLGGDVRGVRDFRSLLDDRDVDAVVISTPDHWHALATMLACAAGKDVYVEKPVTLFVREGTWMLKVARRTGRVVQVGTQQRSGTHYQEARRLLQEGHLGKIVSVQMDGGRNILPGYGSPADTVPPEGLDYDLWLGPAPERAYNPQRVIYHFRWYWDYSGGQMTNLGQHSLDIVDWYVGVEKLRSVVSLGGRFTLERSHDLGETPDVQDALFEFDGWQASWSHREVSGGDMPRYGLRFYGTKGSLGIGRNGFEVVPDRDVPSANTVPQFTGAHPVGGPERVVLTGEPRLRTTAIENSTGDDRAQFKAHVRDFLDCIRTRRTPVSDLESGHRVATLCHLANLSLRLGRQLRWDAASESVVADAQANALLSRPYRSPWDRELQALHVE